MIMAPRRAPSWQEPFEQGVKALGENRLDDAVAAFNIALTSAAHIAAIHQQLGVALHKQERLPAALASFRRAVELKPDSAVQCSNLGIALRDQSRFDEAASWFARACALSPDHAKNHFRWGLALMKAMRPGEALAPLRRAASLAPGDSGTALSLALCYLASGDFVRGGRPMRRALVTAIPFPTLSPIAVGGEKRLRAPWWSAPNRASAT
jgi:protein O-GlcNAc transferase